MCTRYLLTQEHLRAVLVRLGLPVPGKLPATRYNIPPGGPIPVVRAGLARRGATPGHDYAALPWGLIPSWARSTDSAQVNARAETLAEKPSFRDAFRRRRCLIPASGFYEWKVSGPARQPWLFRRPGGTPFGLAGLWETWTTPEGGVRETCAVITTAPNTLMEPIHHRMPVVLAEEAWDAWLDPALTEPADLAPLLQPWSADAMTAIAVTSRMNRSDFDDPSCLEPTVAVAPPRPDVQLGLSL